MISNAMFLIDLQVVPNAAHMVRSGFVQIVGAKSKPRVHLNGQHREIGANESKSPDRSGAIDAYGAHHLLIRACGQYQLQAIFGLD